jgi:hypothetical protein
LNDIKCIRTTLERLEGGRDILGSPDFKFSDFTLLTRPSAARCRELAKADCTNEHEKAAGGCSAEK